MKNRFTEGVEYQKLLFDIHNKEKWPDELLESTALWVFKRLLKPVEREIVLAKIEGKSIDVIAHERQVAVDTINRHIYTIQSVYRTGFRPRVDDWKAVRGESDESD